MNKLMTVLLLLLLGACQPEPAPPLAGARIGGPFELTGADGRTVTDRDFAGQWRVIYFGYTFCPDVCPLDMANLSKGLAAFRQERPDAKVALVFVTVDPARDTPKIVGQFARAFGSGTTGLTGSPAAIDGVKKAFGIYSAKRLGSAPEAYLVDHSRTTYLMDPDGKPVALLPAERGPDAVAAELEKWIT